MTEREKMIQGLPYDPLDKELIAGRLNARKLVRRIAEIPMDKEKQRRHVFKELLGTTGARFYIENPFICDYGYNIHWGENAYANFDCIILDAAPVYIGKNVMLAPGVKILTSTHPLEYEARNSGIETAEPIRIGDNVWVGGGVIINPGVTIGENSVIGSGSVIVEDIPSNVVAVGNPCKVLKSIDNPKK
ncbi:sugar O-acetyltransferase [Aurantibacter crassamenti]|uniref:sugar O-acetyltransferase n=1 Tax=Aurantibacter crassamenti TaxID=1837375 RepID=UPI0019392711|nr:sugar O-acetyltransferase [Aurantibacter crassamenti]MBM1105541.1 sugar O-acetyltransferase [Aurantibacter crassamenti]